MITFQNTKNIVSVYLDNKHVGNIHEEFWRWWTGLDEFKHSLAYWEIQNRKTHMQNLIQSSVNQVEGLYK